jgi:hypothetical protein
VASWLLGVDDCHRCILDLHSVILDGGFWVWNCLQDGVGRLGSLWCFCGFGVDPKIHNHKG